MSYADELQIQMENKKRKDREEKLRWEEDDIRQEQQIKDEILKEKEIIDLKRN